jgi:MSHA biogenesis protein MshJ
MASVDQLKYWLQGRTQEQRVGVLLAGLLGCFIIWYILWEGGYQNSHTALSQQINPLQEKITKMEEQSVQMQKTISNPQNLEKHKQLVAKLNEINAQLKAISTHLVSTADMDKVLKNVMAEDPGLTLISFENTANSPLSNVPGSPDKVKSNPATAQKLYRHDFVMIFEGNYFATLSYLKKLEKLPWQFYWDNMDYEVTTYPKAKITLKLHTVNTEEGLMNVP